MHGFHRIYPDDRTVRAGPVNFAGEHYRVDTAKLWGLPEQRVPIGIAVSGQQSCELFAPHAQVMVGIEPNPELASWWDGVSSSDAPAGGSGSRKVAQLPISWDSDRDAAIERAHRLFRWSLTGWKVNAELPGPAHFAAVAGKIPCGDDVEAVVTAAREFFDAGYTDLALVQVGPDAQDSFLRAAEQEILLAFRAL